MTDLIFFISILFPSGISPTSRKGAHSAEAQQNVIGAKGKYSAQFILSFTSNT